MGRRIRLSVFELCFSCSIIALLQLCYSCIVVVVIASTGPGPILVIASTGPGPRMAGSSSQQRQLITYHVEFTEEEHPQPAPSPEHPLAYRRPTGGGRQVHYHPPLALAHGAAADVAPEPNVPFR